MKRLQRRKGFSLIEMIIYISVLAMLLVALVNMTGTLLSAYRSIKALRLVESAAVNGFERMTREIRLAQSVTVASSNLNSHPGRLFLTSGASTTEFYLDNGILQLKENGVYQGPLTPLGASTTNLVFRLATSSVSSAVKIEMDIEGTVGSVTKTKSFFSTITTRAGY